MRLAIIKLTQIQLQTFINTAGIEMQGKKLIDYFFMYVNVDNV